MVLTRSQANSLVVWESSKELDVGADAPGSQETLRRNGVVPNDLDHQVLSGLSPKTKKVVEALIRRCEE